MTTSRVLVGGLVTLALAVLVGAPSAASPSQVCQFLERAAHDVALLRSQGGTESAAKQALEQAMPHDKDSLVLGAFLIERAFHQDIFLPPERFAQKMKAACHIALATVGR